MKIKLSRAFGLYVFLLFAHTVDATENNARDYFSAPEGTKLGVFYFADIQADSSFSAGNEIATNLEFEGQAALVRWVHHDKCFSRLCNFQLIQPVQRLNSDALGLHATGFADSIVGGTIWLQNEPEMKSYVGLTNFLFMPSGALGISGERWQTNHMLNVTRPAGPFIVEGTLDLNFYGEKVGQDSTNKKDPYFTIQLHASYDITPATYIATRYRYAGGGEEKTNGQVTVGEAKNHQLALEIARWFSPRDQLMLHYNQDLDVENGLEQSQLWLRYIRVF